MGLTTVHDPKRLLEVLLRASRELQTSAIALCVLLVLAPVLFGEPLARAECVSLFVVISAASLLVRDDWSWIERLTFPAAIALPVHLLLLKLLTPLLE